MANNADILGEEAAVRQIVENDFSATNGVFEDDSIVSIRKQAFHARSLVNVAFPNVETVDDSAFNHCALLEELYLPKATRFGNAVCFQIRYDQTGARITIVLPKISTLGISCFRQGQYVAVDLGEDLHNLPSDSFYACTVGTVILRSKTLVTAATEDAVNSIKNLYVPAALVADYATATNWVTNAANRTVTAIEGSEYEHYYANGIAIE